MESPGTLENDTGQGGISSGSESSARKRPQTVSCFLCGGTQIYPGPRYENHLINEHGVLDIDFMIAITLYKQKYGSNPSLENPTNTNDAIKSTNDDKEKHAKKNLPVDTSDAEIQTNFDIICSKCTEVVEFDSNGFKKSTMHSCNGIGKEFNEGTMASENNSQEYYAENTDEDEERYAALLAATEYSDRENFDSSNGSASIKQELSSDIIQRRSVSEQWAPNSWSSTFTCHFCNDQFRKDYKLKLHLMLNHKNEDPEEMAIAMEVLTKGKLDGCVHKCKLCDSKFNSVANISRHLSTVHQMSRSQYSEVYGSSEFSTRTFQCEICDTEIKHTRAIITSHMKHKHLISWKEYQDIILKLKRGINVGELPKPELFDCIICGSRVKYQREHLRKTHQITVETYDELLVRKSKGENINKMLPKRKVYECVICGRETMDLRTHLHKTHQLTLERYQQDFDINVKLGQRKFIATNSEKEQRHIVHNIMQNQNGIKQSPGLSQTDLEKKSPIFPKPEQFSPNADENLIAINQDQQFDSSSHTAEDFSEARNNQPKPPKSDIQNKHNKRCSSCLITFDSRISFIKHCTRDHNMTFKAKTGATISAPKNTRNILGQNHNVKEVADLSVKSGVNLQRNEVSEQVTVQQRLNQKRAWDGVAIKQETTNAGREQQDKYSSKRPRANTLASPITSVGLGGKRILHLQIGRNKWNQCRYECCFCKQSTMARGSMTSHLRDIHGIHIKDYKEAGYPDIEVETNWFKCRLCPTRTKFVKDCIEPHIRMSHSLYLDTYEKEYMKEEDWPYHVVTHNGEINFSQPFDEENATKTDNSDLFEERNVTKPESDSNCPFPNCWAHGYTFADSNLLGQHLVDVHKFSMFQDLSKLSMIEVKKEDITFDNSLQEDQQEINPQNRCSELNQENIVKDCKYEVKPTSERSTEYASTEYNLGI